MALTDVISQQQAPPEQAPMAAQQQASPNDDVEQPVDQDAYERIVLAGVKVLSDPETNPAIMKMLADESSGEPAKRLASTASTIVSNLHEQAQGEVPPGPMVHASGEILLNVAEFAKEAGVMEVDQPTLGKASQYLLMDLSDMLGFSMEDLEGEVSNMDPAERDAIVAEQDGYAQSGQAPAAAAPAAAPAAQQMPGIINQTIGT